MLIDFRVFKNFLPLGVEDHFQNVLSSQARHTERPFLACGLPNMAKPSPYIEIFSKYGCQVGQS